MRSELWLAAAALVCGGWVCNRDGEDPCSDELTCSTPVAGDVCCPLDSPYWCDGACSATPTCSSPITCVNGDGESGACSAATFTAQIDSASCTPGYVVATGQIIGCGSIGVVIGVDADDATLISGNCGDWLFGTDPPAPTDELECVPTSVSAPVQTAWKLDMTLGSPVVSTRVVLTTHSGREIASALIDCR
jgi:hypothetical protein